MFPDLSLCWLDPSGPAASLLDEIPVGLLRLDATGAAIWSSEVARDLLHGPSGAEMEERLPSLAMRAAAVGGTVELTVPGPTGEVRILVAPAPDGVGFVAAVSFDASERSRAQVRALRAMLAGVAAAKSPLDAVGRGLEALGHALPDTQLVVFALEGSPPALVSLARAARPEPLRLVDDRCLSAEALSEQAVRARRPIHVGRIVPALPTGTPGRRGHSAGSLALPIFAEREVVGAIYASGPMLPEGDLRLVQGFADAAGSLIAKARGGLALEAERRARAESEAGALRAREIAVQREGLASLGQLVACIAHEINNPLAALRSNLRGLASGFEVLCGLAAEKEAVQRAPPPAPGSPTVDLAELAGELREMMSDSIAGLERMSGIIQTLKGMARRSPGQPTAFDPATPIQDAVAVFRGARAERVELTLALADGLPEVVGMPGALSQVLINLLENAVDAMDGRGRIAVRAQAVAGGVVVEVVDEGLGIPLETAPRIFEPYFTTKPVGKGTGLGLYICKEMVEQMGGAIDFDTGPGGTTFRLHLPAARW